MARIRPERDLHASLLRVEKPGRYVGGEYGSYPVDPDAELRVAVCFPDLYEIGMANHAIRILYRMFNEIPGVSCERVFAPAPDFEAELRSTQVPLYALESGRPLSEFDVVAFSIGYELAATTVLAVLETGGVPMRRLERGATDPIVIAGGPAVTNPVPIGATMDAVFIGEAEGVLPELFRRLCSQKKRGATRDDLIDSIVGEPSVWAASKHLPVVAAKYREFGKAAAYTAFPVPGLRTVQDHGAVEIMRGCPNGCRFCHAGVFYRPFREKSYEVISEEVEYLVHGCGYREVTLSSLSTGDYSSIHELVRRLNLTYSAQRVSFSLPSIRIDSFTLSLISAVSAVRKSGLTFAVETPEPAWQRGLNKEVSLEKTISIILEAKERGWRVAKFYFMLGLPVSRGEDETPAIAAFLDEVTARTGMAVNVNIATFVPKPHTPFQWAGQLTESESNRRIQWLRNEFRKRPVTVRYNAPFGSVLEGIISRGDERAGQVIESAYRRGARLDAWEEYFQWDAWRGALSEAPWNPEVAGLAERTVAEPLPWDTITLGMKRSALERERKRALDATLTAPCAAPCSEHCGVCRTGLEVRTTRATTTDPEIESTEKQRPIPSIPVASLELAVYVAELAYRKTGRAAYLSHLDTVRLFGRVFSRAGIGLSFSRGFNPKPRIEFAHPISLGFSSEEEIVRIMLSQYVLPEALIRRVNAVMHHGFEVRRVRVYPKPHRRLPSLMSRYWGSDFEISTEASEAISADRMWKLIEEEAAARGVEEHLMVLACDGEKLTIRARSAGKLSSLRRILGAIAETHAAVGAVRVVRLRCYARRADELTISETPPTDADDHGSFVPFF